MGGLFRAMRGRAGAPREDSEGTAPGLLLPRSYDEGRGVDDGGLFLTRARHYGDTFTAFGRRAFHESELNAAAPSMDSDPWSVQPRGPTACLLVGFTPEEAIEFKKGMMDMEGDFVSILSASEETLEQKLGEVMKLE